MRIALIIVIGIHGVIHLFGFLKAFGLSEFNAINQPISKLFGILWLLTFVLFAVTVFLLFIHSNYWWVIGIVAVILSQLLILNYWTDAKFGTIINLIVLVLMFLLYSTGSFKKMVSDETAKKFLAMRYKDGDDALPTEWTVTATKTEERNGIKIPVESKAEWKLENGNWTWLKLKITDISYNLEEIPMALD